MPPQWIGPRNTRALLVTWRDPVAFGRGPTPECAIGSTLLPGPGRERVFCGHRKGSSRAGVVEGDYSDVGPLTPQWS